MLKIKKFLSFFSLSFIFFNQIVANESNQAHQKSVSAVSSILKNGEQSVFSAGADGFLIKWNDADFGEHYQVSEYTIKMIAQNPVENEIAIYETDGASFHRVSVWNWKNQTKKFAYRFDDSVTSLSYSAKGSYLICGTSTSNGAFFINTKTEEIESKKIKENTGIFTFATTSDSEKSLVTYSPIGTLNYYNFQSGEKKQKIEVESNLTNVCMFNKSLFLSGLKDNNVYIVHAMTGKTLGSYKANNSIFVNSTSSENFYYIVNEVNQFKLYEVKNENGKKISKSKLIRTFSGLKNGDSVTSASISGEQIYAGTKKGNIYKFDYEEAERVDVLLPITDDNFDTVLDIAENNSRNTSDFYILTPTTIHQSFYSEGYIDRKCSNPGYENMLNYENELILWSKNTRKAVIKLNPETDKQTELFTPTGKIQVLKVFGNNILTIESNSIVNKYNLLTGKKEKLYQGTNIQDFVFCNEKDLYIAKSSATAPNSPLIYVNTRTQETVPLSLDGTFAYSLSINSDLNELYGIVIDSNSKNPTTSMFSFNLNTKTSKKLFTISEEEIDIFMTFYGEKLFTNIGKSNIVSYNLKTDKKSIYKRSESMPLKVVKNKDKLIVLNRNGSVSWYDIDATNISSNWYLNNDGQWLEL